MKKLVVVLVVLFAFAAVGFAADKADKKAAGDKAADTKDIVKSVGMLVSIDKEKKEIVVDLGKKKKADKKTFVIDAKILESLKDVKEGAMVEVTLKADKVISVKLAEKKEPKKEEKKKDEKK